MDAACSYYATIPVKHRSNAPPFRIEAVYILVYRLTFRYVSYYNIASNLIGILYTRADRHYLVQPAYRFSPVS